MARYLYRITPTRIGMLTKSTPEEEQVIADHFAYLAENAAAGRVLLAGRTQNADADSFGIVILEMGSDAEAEEFMESDPAVRHGVMAARLFPYRVAIGGHVEAG